MLGWQHFLFLTLLCILAQGFFSMFEMACVSFNRIRLRYYVSQKQRRAQWINYLLDRPSRLFGTTLILVNTFLQIGSECARRFYESLQLSPDFAPVTQVFIVVVFAELAPMFAARRHPEQVAMLYVPVAYFISKLLSPLIYLIDLLNAWIHAGLKTNKEVPLFLSREEIQKAFEEKVYESSSKASLDRTLATFFQLKNQTVSDFMYPFQGQLLISSQVTAEELIEELKHRYTQFIPIFHQDEKNIVAVLFLRDLLKADLKRRAVELGHPPWFIAAEDSLINILKQFRSNNQSVAIVLDKEGKAVGMLSLKSVLEGIFGKVEEPLLEEAKSLYIERTLSGNMSLQAFNFQFQAHLQGGEEETLSEYLTRILGHHPTKGETIRAGHFEFKILEPSLFGAKTIQVKTFT